MCCTDKDLDNMTTYYFKGTNGERTYFRASTKPSYQSFSLTNGLSFSSKPASVPARFRSSRSRRPNTTG